jgi:hypothetical protein
MLRSSVAASGASSGGGCNLLEVTDFRLADQTTQSIGPKADLILGNGQLAMTRDHLGAGLDERREALGGIFKGFLADFASQIGVGAGGGKEAGQLGGASDGEVDGMLGGHQPIGDTLGNFTTLENGEAIEHVNLPSRGHPWGQRVPVGRYYGNQVARLNVKEAFQRVESGKKPAEGNGRGNRDRDDPAQPLQQI